MSKITLKPLDDGQKAVVIPLGKTTIGRGAFLGCSDKKVSRNHAVLEVTTKGEVFLTPTHVNPCFFRPTEDSPGQILKKDSPHRLEDGDSFSLLPRAYRYQVNIIPPETTQEDTPAPKQEGQRNEGETNGSTGDDAIEENDHKEEKEQSKDTPSASDKPSSREKGEEKRESPEKEKASPSPPLKEEKRPSPPPQVKEKSPPKEEKNKEEENHKGEEKEEEGESSNHLEEEGEEKEKKEEEERMEEEESKDEGTLDTLPSKLSEGEEEDGKKKKKRGGGRKKLTEPKAPKRKAGVLSGRGRKKASLSSRFDFGEDASSSQRVSGGRTSSRTNRQTRQGLSLEDFIVSDDDEWQSDAVSPRKRRRRKKKKGGDESGSDWESERKKPKKTARSDSESGSDWGSHATPTPKKKVAAKKQGAPKGRRRKGAVAGKAAANQSEEEEEPNSEVECLGPASPKVRKPCTYGKKCYRRNQSHVLEFSHPGDSDYEEDEEDEAPPVKKECPYGANCFRKNAQHKRDFKHTQKVRPQREAAKDKKGGGSKNTDEIDSYDLNDSFDNSADEYKQADSGSDYETTTTTAKKGKAKGGRRGKKAA